MKLYIGGDVCPTEATERYFAAGDVQTAFGTVADLVKDGDRFIVNLECALTDGNTPIRKFGPNLKGCTDCVNILTAMGITDVSLSNNHVYDFGAAGFADTKATLDKAGIAYTGIGDNEQDARRPHYMEIGGKKIALIAVCEHEYSYALRNRQGCWAFDPFETMEDVAIAKENSDFVIVFYHGGKEQCLYPSPRLRKACQGLVRAGADLVLCQHSHCIGVEEIYRGSHIVYGQGNLNFVGLVDHPHWESGLLLELELDDDMNPAYTYHPVVCTEHGVTLAEGERKAQLLADFTARTQVLLDDDAWLKEWNAFCVGMRAQYQNAVHIGFDGNNEPDAVPDQLFPHYLDCEAHTDVWRELYPTWNGDNTVE